MGSISRASGEEAVAVLSNGTVNDGLDCAGRYNARWEPLLLGMKADD